MASNITVDTLTKGSTTLNTDEIVDTNSSQACKAWASYNGKDNVFYSAFNVSSVVDNGTGSFTFNFTNSLGNTDYSVTTVSRWEITGSSGYWGQFSTPYALTANSVSINSTDNSAPNSLEDGRYNTIQVFSN